MTKTLLTSQQQQQLPTLSLKISSRDCQEFWQFWPKQERAGGKKILEGHLENLSAEIFSRFIADNESTQNLASGRNIGILPELYSYIIIQLHPKKALNNNSDLY